MGESSDDHDVDVEIRDEEMSSSSKLGDTTTTLSLQVRTVKKAVIVNQRTYISCNAQLWQAPIIKDRFST